MASSPTQHALGNLPMINNVITAHSVDIICTFFVFVFLFY